VIKGAFCGLAVGGGHGGGVGGIKKPHQNPTYHISLLIQLNSELTPHIPSDAVFFMLF